MQRSREGAVAEAPAVDLTNCDREPIHIPGHIQPHGALLVLAEPGLEILRVGANSEGLLGVPPDALLGSALERLIEPDRWTALRSALLGPGLKETNPLAVLAGRDGHRRPFDGIAHRNVDGLLILELEPAAPEAGAAPGDYTRDIRRAMGRLQAATDLREFCRVAAAEVRALTGFDRVTAYRFDPYWNGEVYAEDAEAGLDPLFGLHFPASDIPEPARRLYTLNPLRLIADAGYRPSPILAAEGDPDGRPLDLSYATLRSVSPIHIQYLKNMGATASMSISLMRDGRLWGLLSCMNYGRPGFVPYRVRATCEFLGVLVSVQLGVKEESQDSGYRAGLQATREQLLRRMAESADLVEGLTGHEPNLLALADAQGAAIVFDGECSTIGATPTRPEILDLVRWLKVHADGEVFHTDSLSRLYPAAEAYKGVASGLISIATSKAQGHYVLWFRPEVVRTVDWGGDPNKAVEVSGSGEAARLSPRTSFEKWKEVVRLRSVPWLECEVDAARGLRDAILAVVVRRAEELTRLNLELERSNTDLDAFAYVASHDLKEPLRGIHNYATFLVEDYGEILDGDGVAKLRTMVRLTQRMEDLIESLLRYSRLGRVGLSFGEVALGELVGEVLEGLRPRLEETGAEVRIPRPLPTLRCDRVQVGEIYANLIANAIKYNDKDEIRLEIGHEEPVPAADPGGRPPPVLFVRDNGIGIPEKHRNAIFRLFKRLHGRDVYGGGTGAGLTIARKIVERHGGSMWVESTVGAGSTFYFTLGS